MKILRALVLFVLMTGGTIWGLSLAQSNLPSYVSYENVVVNPNASTASRWAFTTAINTGAAEVTISDYLFFRTANIRVGKSEFTMVAFPGTKWMRL